MTTYDNNDGDNDGRRGAWQIDQNNDDDGGVGSYFNDELNEDDDWTQRSIIMAWVELKIYLFCFIADDAMGLIN